MSWLTGGGGTGTSWASASAIARGFATLGQIGFEARYDYAAIGTVTNLSARLSSHAKAGRSWSVSA